MASRANGLGELSGLGRELTGLGRELTGLGGQLTGLAGELTWPSRLQVAVGLEGVRPDTLSEQRRLYLMGRVVVARHYRRPLTLAAVARAISTSPRQLQRAYARFGSSFGEDLLARRMAVAAQLLAEQPSIAVGDVARLVGYRQRSNFARAFRRRYGLSPAVFRARALRHAALTRERDREVATPARRLSPQRL